MRLRLLTSSLAAAALFGTAAHAATVTPNTWQQVNTPVTIGGEVITSSVNTNATASAFWNNSTADGSSCLNIGCFVTKTGGFSSNANSPALFNPVYLGNNNGSAFGNFSLSAGPAGSASQPVTMLAEVAGNASRNWLGWYDASITDLSQLNSSNWGVIFNGAATTGASTTFTPTTNFGFWMAYVTGPTLSVSNIRFLTNTGLQSGDSAGNQHFALFARSAAAANVLPAQFWLGVEDLPLGNADKDYNDMIVSFEVVPVPEPGSFALMALGLGAFAIMRRRMSAAKS